MNIYNIIPNISLTTCFWSPPFRLLPTSWLRDGGAIGLPAGGLPWLRSGRLSVQQSVCDGRRPRRLSHARLRRLLAQSGHLLLDATAAAHTAARQDQGRVSVSSFAQGKFNAELMDQIIIGQNVHPSMPKLRSISVKRRAPELCCLLYIYYWSEAWSVLVNYKYFLD